MGEVYLAEDSELERKVALKVLLSDVAADEERIRRFVQEAKAASALNHPNILTVHEIGNFDQTRYIVTEYIKGETLRDRLQREPLTLRETLDITLQVAAALSAAHGAHIVHRDIKPENIMLRDDGFVKVLDFGLAKLADAPAKTSGSEDATRAQVNTAPGAVMGTADYMSPEQARGKETDARTDVWSLGVVFYEVLAGQSPFKGETTNDTIAAILTKEPPLLDENIPHELHRITKRALQKKADDRYQTVQDFLLDVRDLKRELEFSEELERSHIPQLSRAANVGITASGESPTAAHSGALSTRDSSTHQPSSAEYIVSEIKQHKRGVLGVLGVLLIVLVGAGAYFYWFASPAAATIKSVAVLPFANVGDDPEFEFATDGLAEALINNLSRLPNMKVIARSSSFTFKGKDVDPVEAAQKLGVEAIVTGRMQRRGDDVTISVEMVNAADRTQMWGETYERKVSEMRNVHVEIARTVSENLRNRLTGELEAMIAKGETTNPQAYELALKGLYSVRKGGRANHLKTIEYFEQAIALDPQYANALALVSIPYANMQLYGTSAERKGYLQKQRAAVEKSVSIAPDSFYVLNALGALRWNEYKWQEAEAAFRRAIEVNPNAAGMYLNLAGIYSILKRHDEAIALGKRAIDLDPLRPTARVGQLNVLLNAGRYDEVVQLAPEALAVAPDDPGVHYSLAGAYERKKMHTEALAEVQKACDLDKEDLDCPIFLATFYASSGDRIKAEAILKENAANIDSVTPIALAGLYGALGENGKALDLLENAFAAGESGLEAIAIDFTLDPLRGEQRFKELLRKLNLPE